MSNAEEHSVLLEVVAPAWLAQKERIRDALGSRATGSHTQAREARERAKRLERSLTKLLDVDNVAIHDESGIISIYTYDATTQQNRDLWTGRA